MAPAAWAETERLDQVIFAGWTHEPAEAAGRAARRERRVPVTVKMRKGIDDEHLTYLEAAQAAVEEGVAAVALHSRTASQAYSGQADWLAIRQLKEAVTSVPVLGNGDIWSAEDAVRMVNETGVDGVVIGRGCQGRPWLFGDLQAAFDGSRERARPGLRAVAATIASASLQVHGLPLRQAAALPEALLTAWDAIVTRGRLGAGDRRAGRGHHRRDRGHTDAPIDTMSHAVPPPKCTALSC